MADPFDSIRFRCGIRIVPEALSIVHRVPNDQQERAGRRGWIFGDTSWHFESLARLGATQRRNGSSRGLIRPGTVERV